MNEIRSQIQDTAKRIKRLGESSLEIGEIVELISDITEQTNVLALNAAIQAASAGEAGRGFTVVAEEVQRLAERSGEATKQIEAIVKTIQSDTQDAVATMERSTQGVVQGAQLSDAAGAALVDIDRVTRELSALVESISTQAQSEAQSANVVASNIQHIFAVTEQTGDGTRSTAQIVRELSRTAEELRQSVSRFKIALNDGLHAPSVAAPRGGARIGSDVILASLCRLGLRPARHRAVGRFFVWWLTTPCARSECARWR